MALNLIEDIRSVTDLKRHHGRSSIRFVKQGARWC